MSFFELDAGDYLPQIKFKIYIKKRMWDFQEIFNFFYYEVYLRNNNNCQTVFGTID